MNTAFLRAYLTDEAPHLFKQEVFAQDLYAAETILKAIQLYDKYRNQNSIQHFTSFGQEGRCFANMDREIRFYFLDKPAVMIPYNGSAAAAPQMVEAILSVLREKFLTSHEIRRAIHGLFFFTLLEIELELCYDTDEFKPAKHIRLPSSTDWIVKLDTVYSYSRNKLSLAACEIGCEINPDLARWLNMNLRQVLKGELNAIKLVPTEAYQLAHQTDLERFSFIHKLYAVVRHMTFRPADFMSRRKDFIEFIRLVLKHSCNEDKECIEFKKSMEGVLAEYTETVAQVKAPKSGAGAERRKKKLAQLQQQKVAEPVKSALSEDTTALQKQVESLQDVNKRLQQKLQEFKEQLVEVTKERDAARKTSSKTEEAKAQLTTLKATNKKLNVEKNEALQKLQASEKHAASLQEELLTQKDQVRLLTVENESLKAMPDQQTAQIASQLNQIEKLKRRLAENYTARQAELTEEKEKAKQIETELMAKCKDLEIQLGEKTEELQKLNAEVEAIKEQFVKWEKSTAELAVQLPYIKRNYELLSGAEALEEAFQKTLKELKETGAELIQLRREKESCQVYGIEKPSGELVLLPHNDYEQLIVMLIMNGISTPAQLEQALKK